MSWAIIVSIGLCTVISYMYITGMQVFILGYKYLDLPTGLIVVRASAVKKPEECP